MTSQTTTDYHSIARKALATTIARGTTLLTTDRYTVTPYADRPGVYEVARPEDDKRPLRKGETLWNDVDICNQDCTCEGFKFRGNCKHLIAVNEVVANAARLMAPMLPALTVDAAWPPVDRGMETAFVPKTKPLGGYGSAEWNRAVAADFG